MPDRSVSVGGNVDRSIVITGDGNQASIHFGADFTLPLERRQIAPVRRRRRGGYNPLPLLAPDAGAIPLVGRDSILEELRAWLESEADVSAHALIGRAGTGKTRLAIELCKAVDGGGTAGAGGWAAGFLRPSDLASAVERLATTSYDWTGKTLLVVDYAAAVHKELARWLDRFAVEGIAGKLRFLLLDREAPEGFGWWSDLTRPSSSRAGTRADLFVDPERPRLLQEIEALEWRRAVFQSALAAASDLLGETAPGHAIPEPGSDSAFDDALAGPRFGNPLNLAMAGLIAAERAPKEALALRRLEAARYLARRERDRMVRLGKSAGLSERAICHALGFNGLAGGVAIGTLQRDLASEMESANLSADAGELAQLLEQELPQQGRQADDGAEPRLGTIQPDLVGEGVIVETLLVGPQSWAHAAPEAARRAYALTAARAAEALMRLIQDYGYAVEDPQADSGEREVAQATLRLLTAVAEAISDAEVERLETLVWAFPEQTTVLREAAAAQTQRLADIWRRAANGAPHEKEGEILVAHSRLALWLNNLGSRLSDLGRREEALAAAAEAVDLRRALAAARPDTFTPDLAMSLNNLANCLSDLGRREEALAAAEEASNLYRALAAARPDSFTPDLAGSLNNLANCLSALGRREEALAAAAAAVDLYRALAPARPDVFTHDLAMSLNNLANRLSDLGRREEALAAAEEAVDLRSALAAARPDAFKPDLAMSLNNLATFLSALGRREEALAAAVEAVDLRRALAAVRPDAFTPDLAMSLSVLGDCLEKAERIDEAVRADAESVALLSPYFLKAPIAFAGPMRSYLRDHLRRAEAAGIAPEAALVEPILQVLLRMLKEDGQ